MTPVQIIFIIVAATTLGAGLMVVTTRNLVHAALWLVVSLFGVAVLYALLDASFLAVVQVVVYIGAIAILMMFAIMLTRRVAKDSGPQMNANWGWGAILAILVFVGLGFILSQWPGVTQAAPQLDSRTDLIAGLGQALVDPERFLLPFEVASVLLLAALIGAIVIAWDRKV